MATQETLFGPGTAEENNAEATKILGQRLDRRLLDRRADPNHLPCEEILLVHERLEVGDQAIHHIRQTQIEMKESVAEVLGILQGAKTFFKFVRVAGNLIWNVARFVTYVAVLISAVAGAFWVLTHGGEPK